MDDDRPILTPKTVLPLFFAIAIIFAPIGGLLLYASAQVSRTCEVKARKTANIIITQVQEIKIDYTKCNVDAPLFPEDAEMPDSLITKSFKKDNSLPDQQKPRWSRKPINATYYNGTHLGATVATTQCNISFPIENNMKPPVLFYYQLTNFYQNHRRYAKSFNTDQLSGKAVSVGTIKDSDCTPA